MASINTERLLRTFLELVGIDSPSGQEAGVAAYCILALEEAGCIVGSAVSQVVEGSDSGNVIASLPAFLPNNSDDESLPLYFSAHMDTIEPCRGIKPEIREGVIYSDGTTVLGGDDKVGLAAIIEMVRSLAEGEANDEPHPEIRMLFTVREEVGLMGAKALGEQEFKDVQGALCYVLDAAGEPGLIVNGAPYQHSYKARYQGLAAHAGIAPETGISAIRAAAQAVAALPQGRLDESSTTNIGTISGGTVNNVVSAECLVSGELRSHDKERLLLLQAQIEGILRTACLDDKTGAGAPQITVEWEVNYEGFYAPEDSPQVRLAERAARRLGLETRIEKGNGGADTNILASYGLAAVSLGSGMDRVHSTDELLAIADLENLARLALNIVKESGRE